MNTFKELHEEVEKHQNVLTVTMAQLRDIYGTKRLGVHVCEEISRKLSGAGLGHVQELEPDAWQKVRIYKLGTPVGRMLDAAYHPGEEGDAVLREIAESDANERLDQVKAIVCD